MRKVLLTLTFLVLFVSVGLAQDKSTRFSFLIGYSGNEFKPNPADAAEFANGVFIEANGKILARGKFRLDGTINFKRAFDQTLDADYVATLPALDTVRLVAIQRDVDTIAFGPKVSYGIAGPVRIFGAALFGIKNFKFNPNTGGMDNKQFSRNYQAGIDLELGHIVIRPFYFGDTFTNGLLVSGQREFGAGVGFRF